MSGRDEGAQPVVLLRVLDIVHVKEPGHIGKILVDHLPSFWIPTFTGMTGSIMKKIEIDNLARQTESLIRAFEQLKNENVALRTKQSKLLTERAELMQKKC